MEKKSQFEIDLTAPAYLTVLTRLHTLLRPETYLEIGTRHGDSLRLAQCASIAVDPGFAITADILGKKPSCHLYQTTSDRFFEKVKIARVLGGAVELAYLDGMHLAEFLLRDFANIEIVSKPNSVIIMHDCMPSDFNITCRHEGAELRKQSRYAAWWTGDVWKAIWAIKKYRPDLRVVAIDSPPTGLICVTNLNPTSRVLKDNYAEIVRDMAMLDDSDDTLQEYLTSLQPIKPSRISTFEQVSEFFYM